MPCCVPDLGFDLFRGEGGANVRGGAGGGAAGAGGDGRGRGGESDDFGGKLDADSRARVFVEFVAGEAGEDWIKRKESVREGDE